MDIEKTMEFIVEQQAQFYAHIAMIDGRLDRASAEIEQLAQENRAIARAVHAIMEHSQNNALQIEKNTSQIERNATQIASLADQQQQTKDNLDALIKIVDSMVRGKNGGAH